MMNPRYMTKRFDIHEVKRLPVELTDAAREALNLTNEESRKVVLALSEAFAQLTDVTSLSISFNQGILSVSTSTGKTWNMHLDQIKDPRFRAHRMAQELARLHAS